MPTVFTLDEVREMAKDVVAVRGFDLAVLAVTSTGGGGRAYVEILLLGSRRSGEGCRLVLGADRSVSETVLRADIDEQLSRHFASRESMGDQTYGSPMDSSTSFG